MFQLGQFEVWRIEKKILRRQILINQTIQQFRKIWESETF